MGIPWDGTDINCYGMGQINMSHGQPWLLVPCSSVHSFSMSTQRMNYNAYHVKRCVQAFLYPYVLSTTDVTQALRLIQTRKYKNNKS